MQDMSTMYSEKNIIEMYMTLKLYILSSNDPEVHVINIYKDDMNKNGYVKLNETNISLDLLEVVHLRDHVCSIKKVGDSDKSNLKLWKVIGFKSKDIKEKKISTEEDIKHDLEGKEMDLETKFSEYFQDELNDKNKSESSITTIIPATVAYTLTNALKISRLGGLGGTNKHGFEDGHGYEGVDLSHSTVCQREQTIKKLLKCLLKEKIILIRSPPMAGKTTLAQLFENSLLNSDEVKKGSRRVFRISLMWMDRKENPSWTFAEGFERLMNMTWSEFLDKCDVETFLIIDEVQKIYTPINGSVPLHGGDVFWKTFKDVQQYLKLHIVAFASYGYLGAYSVSSGYNYDTSPCQLEKKNTWGFEDVRFTDEEFKDYFGKFCKKNLSMLDEKDSQYLYHYLYVITGLHPGLTAFTMDKIHEKFVKHTSLSFEKIFSYLKSHNFCAATKLCRAAPVITMMTDDEKELADTVLFMKEGLTIRTELVPNNCRIIKTNILVDISKKEGVSTLNFPAPLFRAIYLQDRFGAVQRSQLPLGTFNEFITSVFSVMNPMILNQSLGIGRNGELLERVWQMEFYRAAMQIIPDDVFISVDVGEVFGSNGYIDFYVDDKHDWAIELLRDGINMIGHERKFQENGTYESILKVAKQWAIIDIRNNKKGMPKKQRAVDVIYVSCAEDFEFVDLKYPDKTEKRVKLIGMEEDLLGFHISDFQCKFQDKFQDQMDIDEY